MLVNAIGTLGLERSNFITAEIAQVFRLDEFTVQTGDNYEESSLYIGKYLTPRLFVRYVVGLFDQANRMGLRYQLTESLRLEAESGTNQSVDMIYKFER
jgi:translocation and assembly module TamB